MLLWDIIRDWFVVNIWGGFTSDGNRFGGTFGEGVYFEDGSFSGGDVLTSNSFKIHVGQYFSDDSELIGEYISIGDWLSTTSTIIVMVILCIIFGLMVRWLFRLTSGLLQGR